MRSFLLISFLYRVRAPAITANECYYYSRLIKEIITRCPSRLRTLRSIIEPGVAMASSVYRRVRSREFKNLLDMNSSGSRYLGMGRGRNGDVLVFIVVSNDVERLDLNLIVARSRCIFRRAKENLIARSALIGTFESSIPVAKVERR